MDAFLRNQQALKKALEMNKPDEEESNDETGKNLEGDTWSGSRIEQEKTQEDQQQTLQGSAEEGAEKIQEGMEQSRQASSDDGTFDDWNDYINKE